MQRFAAFAVAALVACLAAALPASASFPGRNGKIVFDGDDGLFTVNPDGSGLRQLTHAKKFFDFAASFSPDGRRIAFERDFDGGPRLFVMGADGGGLRQLANTGPDTCCPAFAPGGDKIAFSRAEHGVARIWTIRLDGTHLLRVTRGPNPAWAEFPAFSPSGGRIAFDGAEVSDGIFAIDNDGHNLKRLTHGYFDVSPNYSPNGRRIVYIHHDQVAVMNADGSHRHRLTDDPWGHLWAVFSPTGRQIAYVREGANPSKDGIYVMRADGTHARRVVTGFVGRVDWQPLPPEASGGLPR